MKRDIGRLAGEFYDLLVIGGGITGVCVAWDAALRGLKVALVESGDFGAATSANSLKTIHGGLRYLQDGNVGLMRTMIRERRAFLRIAPHLARPLPFLMPTTGWGLRSRVAMRLALALNDLISFDRNRGVDLKRRLPGGRILSRAECLRLLPEIDGREVTGGALWYDAQMYNSDRLLLSFVLSAVAAGAVVANYTSATGFLLEGDRARGGSRVAGVTVRDELKGQVYDIGAKVVVNAAGAKVDAVLGHLGGRQGARLFQPSLALNLVTRRIMPAYGVALTGKARLPGRDKAPGERSRLWFIVPWRRYSLIGTIHLACDRDGEQVTLAETDLQVYLDEINAACPGARLRGEDVYTIHRGFLPVAAPQPEVRLLRQDQVYDHRQDMGVSGVISVVGVKYTTARHAAEQVVDLAFEQLGEKGPPCRTRQTPLYGGDIGDWDAFLAEAVNDRPPGLDGETMEHLVSTYGTAYRQLLGYAAEDPGWRRPVALGTVVTGAEVVHAVRWEMAQKLSDVVLRRTELGAAGPPDVATLRRCAQVMAAELGWTQARIEREIDEVGV
jgi:glycerol-3-phosphate dehydrogenase